MNTWGGGSIFTHLPGSSSGLPFSQVSSPVCASSYPQGPSFSATVISVLGAQPRRFQEWLREYSLAVGGGEEATGPSTLTRVIYHSDQDNEKAGAAKLGACFTVCAGDRPAQIQSRQKLLQNQNHLRERRAGVMTYREAPQSRSSDG